MVRRRVDRANVEQWRGDAEPAQPLDAGPVTDDRGRAGVGQLLEDLAIGERGVEAREGGAGAQHAELGGDERRGVAGDEDRDQRLLTDVRADGVGELRGQRIQRAIGQHAPGRPAHARRHVDGDGPGPAGGGVIEVLVEEREQAAAV